LQKVHSYMVSYIMEAISSSGTNRNIWRRPARMSVRACSTAPM